MRPIDRVAYAGDASFYHLIPRAVVQPQTIDEVRSLMAAARRWNLALTFRAAGTSLSGQAVTSGILVDLARGWKQWELSPDGCTVRVEPGVVGGHLNAVLARRARRIGPDPASIDACMMGGIIANNASGMCCGVQENAYHTLESVMCVLASGLVLDTGAPDAAAVLSREAPELAEGLRELRRTVLGNHEQAARIRRKYRIKNTTGYSLNALIDFDEPHQILAHLLVGSEGTLAFVARAALRTLPTLPYRATALLAFESVSAAVDAVAPVRDSGARAVELIDGASLRAIRDLPGTPEEARGLPDDAAALLIEYQADTQETLRQFRDNGARILRALRLTWPAELTEDPARQAALWKVRKGLYPAVGAARPRGTAVIIEDVAFPLPALASAAVDLRGLFAEHGYSDAILFGHAKDGNLHFVLSQSFGSAGEVARYERFMDDVVRLVVRKYDGSLKAEHGTGRNMAPFVEAEWGREARAVMREIKALLDPRGILNPGALLNDDPRAHLQHLKALPQVETEVDRCIECGFCERTCPSRRLTTTPRQRIAIRRELVRLRDGGGSAPWIESIERDFGFAVVDTCATDGLCAMACPVGIDTGVLVKHLREDSHGAGALWAADLVASAPAAAESLVRFGLGASHAAASRLGYDRIQAAIGVLEHASGTLLPKLLPTVPRPSQRLDSGLAENDPEVLYFPSCLSRMMGQPAGEPPELSMTDLVRSVCRSAGVRLRIPDSPQGHCCSMPFASKGFAAAQRVVAARLIDALWRWSEAGRIPVVIDASSCAATLKGLAPVLDEPHRSRWERMTLLDLIELVHDRLLPRLRLKRLEGEVLLLPNCAARKAGLDGKLVSIAEQCAESVYVPLTFSCCATAGDRGLMVPELTRSALQPVREELEGRELRGCYSCNLTCEMGMSEALGRPVRSFLQLVHHAASGQTPT